MLAPVAASSGAAGPIRVPDSVWVPAGRGTELFWIITTIMILCSVAATVLVVRAIRSPIAYRDAQLVSLLGALIFLFASSVVLSNRDGAVGAEDVEKFNRAAGVSPGFTSEDLKKILEKRDGFALIFEGVAAVKHEDGATLIYPLEVGKR